MPLVVDFEGIFAGLEVILPIVSMIEARLGRMGSPEMVVSQ